jgi:hypothetical protein
MLLEKLPTFSNFTESIKFAAFSFVMRSAQKLLPIGPSGGNCSRSLFDKERNLQLDSIFRDLSIIVQFDLLILDPCGLEVRERFMSARHAYYYGIIKTLRGRGYDFSYFRD